MTHRDRFRTFVLLAGLFLASTCGGDVEHRRRDGDLIEDVEIGSPPFDAGASSPAPPRGNGLRDRIPPVSRRW